MNHIGQYCALLYCTDLYSKYCTVLDDLFFLLFSYSTTHPQSGTQQVPARPRTVNGQAIPVQQASAASKISSFFGMSSTPSSGPSGGHSGGGSGSGSGGGSGGILGGFGSAGAALGKSRAVYSTVQYSVRYSVQ